MESKFKMGEHVWDCLVLPFAGKIIAITNHIDGRTQYLVQPTYYEKNEVPKALWFEEGRLMNDVMLEEQRKNINP